MSNLIKVEPDYVFVTIPKDWLPFYYKLIAAIAQHGNEDITDSYNKKCKDKPNSLANCYNMFNAAIAARRLNNKKLSNLIVKYIDAKLDLMYSDIDIPVYEELNYDFNYMDIPAEYIFTYYAILKALQNYGNKMLYDCKVACDSDISSVIDCFNLFNTALIAKHNKNDNFAEILINETNSRLKGILHTDNIFLNFSFYADDSGNLEVFVFYEDNNVVYKIKEEDLDLYNDIFKSNVFDLVFDFTFGT